MQIETRHFGEIEIDESIIINFPEGIPGFRDLKKYVLIPMEDDLPFLILQSIEEKEISFFMISPYYIHDAYDIDIPDEELNVLNIENMEDLQILSVVVIPDDIHKITANLKAPVIINQKNMTAKQAILDTEAYPVKYYFVEKLKEKE